MKKVLFLLLPAVFAGIAVVLAACTQAKAPAPQNGYASISQTEAKKIMDSGAAYTLVDVRTETEYAEGYIPGAVLLPLDDLEAGASHALPDKDRKLLVYCRSGRRSKTASAALAAMGYTDVLDIGGILDWPYGTTKAN